MHDAPSYVGFKVGDQNVALDPSGGGGKLIAIVRDADGNSIGLMQNP